MKKSTLENIKEALKHLQEEKPGLWANIRAKRARGEKPAHKNSNAHKDAVKAGKKINAMSEDKADAVRWFGNLKYYYQKAFAELKGEDRETYKQLAKDFFSKLQIDQAVRPVGLDEQEGSLDEIGMFNDPVGYEKSKPEKPTYTKKYVSKNVYDIFKHGKKVKTVKGSEGEANAWMNNAGKGQQNEAAEGQSISDLKPGDKFEFNGKTFTLVKHIKDNIAKVIRPNGDTSTVSFGGKINTGKKADIGPDAFGQGKGHHID